MVKDIKKRKNKKETSCEDNDIEIQVKNVKTKISLKQILTIISIIFLFLWLLFNISFSIKMGDFYFKSKPLNINSKNVSVGAQNKPQHNREESEDGNRDRR